MALSGLSVFTNQSVQHSLTEAVVPYSNAREDRLHLNGPDVRLSPGWRWRSRWPSRSW